MELPEGLKKIREKAFSDCMSLTNVVLPQRLKIIGMRAFHNCSSLTNVELPQGLEKIEKGAFHYCRSLHAIVIPSSVKEIDGHVFSRCLELRCVQFCVEIEEFVSGESMRGWWNRRRFRKKSLIAYCAFVRYNIPERVSLIQGREWQLNIHEMLRHIPDVEIDLDVYLGEFNFEGDLDSYFYYIDSKLSKYENLILPSYWSLQSTVIMMPTSMTF